MCTTLDQLAYHEQEYDQLVDILQDDLIKITGCSLPCRYKEFKIVGNPVEVDNNSFGFSLMFAKSEEVEEKEAYVYEFMSFVSEFGGSLGLFLGFSFLSSWDLLEILFAALSYQRKTSSPKLRYQNYEYHNVIQNSLLRKNKNSNLLNIK